MCCDGSLPLPLHLAINWNRILDDVSTRGDVDAYSRASRAIKLLIGLSYSILNSIKAIYFIAADIDINLTATFFLDFSCSYHSSY